MNLKSPLLFLLASLLSTSAVTGKKNNVLLIVCDDLNDYVEILDGHPQTQTPNLTKLANSGVSFTQAHCNIPICNPSRASFATGIYPHNSGHFGFEPWNENEVLNNSHTMMTFFASHGYHTLGTGKVMHNHDKGEWRSMGTPQITAPFFLMELKSYLILVLPAHLGMILALLMEPLVLWKKYLTKFLQKLGKYTHGGRAVGDSSVQ